MSGGKPCGRPFIIPRVRITRDGEGRGPEAWGEFRPGNLQELRTVYGMALERRAQYIRSDQKAARESHRRASQPAATFPQIIVYDHRGSRAGQGANSRLREVIRAFVAKIERKPAAGVDEDGNLIMVRYSSFNARCR